jgi:hypothetical protein
VSSVELALGRVEGGRLVRNPLVWLGFGVSALWLREALLNDDAEDRSAYLIGYSLVVPGFFMLCHAALAVLRGRMTGAEELFATVPVTRDRRTVGHGVSTLAAAVTVVCCLAIALVRWIPSWVVLLVFPVLLVLQFTLLGLWYGTVTGWFEWVGSLPTGVVQDGWYGTCSDEPPAYCDLVVSGFERTTPWWHAAYLVALAVWLVTIAVLRHRRDRAAGTAFGGAGAVVVALAVAQQLVLERYSPMVGR